MAQGKPKGSQLELINSPGKEVSKFVSLLVPHWQQGRIELTMAKEKEDRNSCAGAGAGAGK